MSRHYSHTKSLQIHYVQEQQDQNNSKNKQLISIISQALENYDQSSNHTQIRQHPLYRKMVQQHNREIQSLKLQHHLKESQYKFSMQQMKNQFDEIKHQYECTNQQNIKLKQFLTEKNEQLCELRQIVKKYEKKLRNQQSLIDQYKNSIQQQISLQKQVIRASYKEKELQNKLKFENALKSMSQNYQRKIKQFQYNKLKKQYQIQMKNIKRFCSKLNNSQYNTLLQSTNSKNKTINKENILGISHSTKKLQGASSYSTIQK